jgi:hypothetical protein
MIRITLERGEYVAWNGKRVEATTIVREFSDVGEASSWFVHDSYFAEPYTVRAAWEVVAETPPTSDPFTQPAADRPSTDRDRLSGVGPVFLARFTSECNACGFDLEEGDEARMVDGSAMHASCAADL